jgi:hypothetical protein
MWLWLLSPLALLLLATLVVVLQGQWRSAADPPPLDQDSFHLRAWPLPRQYERLSPVQVGDGPGVALTVGVPGRQNYYNNLDRLLRLEPDAAGGLAIAHDYPRGGALLPMQLNLDGRILRELSDRPVRCGSRIVYEKRLALEPLPDSPGGRNEHYTFFLPDGGTWWFTQLRQGHVAIVKPPELGDGTAELWIGQPGKEGRAVDKVERAVACGDAWLADGPSLAVLTRAGQLYIVDRGSERFVLQPALRPLAVAALADTPHIAKVVVSGGLLAAFATNRTQIRFYGADGSRLALRLVDPQLQNPDGSPRLQLPLGLPLNLPFFAPNNLNSPAAMAAYARRARADGHRARLDVFATGDAFMFPSRPDQFVLYDELYSRLVVVSHDPVQASR